MRRALSILLAAVFLAPVASAGTEAAPEIQDASDQSSADVDLLSAWFENTWDGVRFTVKVRGFDISDLPKHSFFVGFSTGGPVHVASVEVGADGKIYTVAAKRGYGDLYPTLADLPNNLIDVEITPGRPAYVSAVIPWGAVPGFEPGEVMSNLYAGVDDGRQGDGLDYVDVKSSTKTFATERILLGRPVAEWTLPLAGGLLAFSMILVGVLAFVLHRRKRDATPSVDASPTEGSSQASNRTPEAHPPERAATTRVRLDPRQPE